MPDASHWCFLKSDQTARIHPPPETPFKLHNSLGPRPLQMKGVLSPNAPTSGLMVGYTVYRNTGRNVFWYKPVSIRHECTTADPFDAKKKVMEFTSVVRCGAKFYATSLQGALVVMQANDARLRITGISATRGVPSVRCRFFKEYLVEMKGEILLVFLIHERSVAAVDGIEVFRLDFGKLDWIRVERLGGNTLFLNGRCSIWVDSEEFGCRDDRVYFTNEQNRWCVYDMKTACISSA